MAFQTLQPTITAVHQVTNSRTGAFPITSIADALKAINQIKEQGEGTQTTPFAADFDPNDLAHYYRFKEIREEHKLQKAADGTFKFDGAPIAMPQVFAFAAAADPSATLKFNTILSDLLRMLERTWTVNASNLGGAVGMMFSLGDEGTRLIAAGIRPDFKFTSQSNLSHAAGSLAVRGVAPVTTRSRRRPRVMRVNTRQGSPVESLYRAAAGLTPAALVTGTGIPAVPVPDAITPGLRPTPAHDLVFHNGATITDLLYFNFFVGGQASWNSGDISNSQTALLGIMADRQLNNVMQQVKDLLTGSWRGNYLPQCIFECPAGRLSRGVRFPCRTSGAAGAPLASRDAAPVASSHPAVDAIMKPIILARITGKIASELKLLDGGGRIQCSIEGHCAGRDLHSVGPSSRISSTCRAADSCPPENIGTVLCRLCRSRNNS